jgi:hypothetical protein
LTDKVRVDLNEPRFQDDLLSLPVEEFRRVLKSLHKIRRLTWTEFYRDRGLKWEAIESVMGPEGNRVYSFRITQKMRALAYRRGEWLRLASLHPDHDSAYD